MIRKTFDRRATKALPDNATDAKNVACAPKTSAGQVRSGLAEAEQAVAADAAPALSRASPAVLRDRHHDPVGLRQHRDGLPACPGPRAGGLPLATAGWGPGWRDSPPTYAP